MHLGIGRGKATTHLKTGPGAYAASTEWRRVAWRCDGYYPDEPDARIDLIVFHQRVAGGFERPEGGALHEIQLDNVQVVAGDAAARARALAEKLGGLRCYDGPQAFAVAQTEGLTIWHSPSTAKVFKQQPPPERRGTA